MKPVAIWRAAALLLVALWGAGAGGAWAQTAAVVAGLEAELRRCRGIADSLARIACYDAIALPQGSSTAPAMPAAVPAQAGALPTTAATAVAPPAAASSAPLREFGLPERPSHQQVQSIESSLPGAFDGWTPGSKLRLANGQLWEIVDGSTAAYSLRDPKVHITRGMLGSFFMSIEGAAHQPRVRRLQ